MNSGLEIGGLKVLFLILSFCDLTLSFVCIREMMDTIIIFQVWVHKMFSVLSSIYNAKQIHMANLRILEGSVMLKWCQKISSSNTNLFLKTVTKKSGRLCMCVFELWMHVCVCVCCANMPQRTARWSWFFPFHRVGSRRELKSLISTASNMICSASLGTMSHLFNFFYFYLCVRACFCINHSMAPVCGRLESPEEDMDLWNWTHSLQNQSAFLTAEPPL